MAGYNGYSMSNNAIDAYNSGERPITKWSKATIINKYQELCNECNIKAYDLTKINVQVLRRRLLHISSWHHTSSRYNETNFYELSIDMCESLTEEIVQEMINYNPTKIEVASTVEKWQVEYLTWEGTRKHPKAIKHIETVEYDSNKKYVETSVGRKMISANGFQFIKKVEG